MRTRALTCCCLALLVAAPARLLGQESLAAARQLYAAAEYHNALAMLGALLEANPPRQERQAIELYRIFCFFAINDVEDGTKALEAMILRDPLYRPSLDLVPRRLRTAFSDARKRLLPTIIQEKYVVARGAFDQGDYKVAATGFTQVLMALSDPDIAAEAEERPLADLRVLASGFHELAVRAVAGPMKADGEAVPPAAAGSAPPTLAATPRSGSAIPGSAPTASASPASVSPGAASPGAASGASASTGAADANASTRALAEPASDSPAAANGTSETPASVVPAAPRIYRANDAGVTVPVIIRQDMPRFPLTVISQRSGQIEVVIDQTGAVESATMVASMDPRYDALVVAAARFWRYKPATVDGVPVKFSKRIQMTMTPER